MSFGGQETSSGLTLKSFVTEDEVEEKKRIRQEQWDKVRKPDDPVECPEEDTRSLYDKLQEQKDRKQQEYEDQFKFSNAVKGLEEEEVNFLEEVSQRQMAIEKQRLNEETSILQEMRNANVTIVRKSESAKEVEKPAAKTLPSNSSRKSQQSLLLGAVKRKGSDGQGDNKKLKTDSSKDSCEASCSKDKQDGVKSQKNVARVIGILPGIKTYSDDSTDSNSSNSDSELDDLMSRPTVKRIVITTKEED